MQNLACIWWTGPESNSDNTGRYSDYHSLNFRVDYRHKFSHFLAVSMYIDIMNLYNRENETGDTFQAISGKMKRGALPMVPTFGLKLEL